MALNIRSRKVNELAGELAAKRHVTKTEAVRIALENELRRSEDKVPLREKIKHLQERVAAYPDTGLEADKAFFDELSGEY
ncbi:type II toxin-antitoxin system VapB family antitoxin [Rhizobium sp. TRM95111]|uniref:type II toxin-antitoxin system VapB family antitoxin n=1 Tax=Rhizobium alarense TaxID=2846851 RepID=UPI001F3B1B6F|nr:type II toxin-antitoxin system VapB family antitoxin [Rhizobium alarense]MCF3641564.1 type II toxin-antitoxin system VapB family antitoxin [Rhizobium alarense]